jgi:hypothetical protein
MAEAPKKFTEKVGYQGALDFDPVNGIVKFGRYEMFAKDLGITPVSTKVTFDDYLKAQTPTGGAFSQLLSTQPVNRDAMRKQFEADVMSGAFTGYQPPNMAASIIPTPAGEPAFKVPAPAKVTNEVRNVQRLGPDTFSVDTYVIPNDQDKGYELLNQISARAGGTRQVRRDSALLSQNRQDASLRRQGAGSTVLGGANSAAGAAAKAINS